MLEECNGYGVLPLGDQNYPRHGSLDNYLMLHEIVAFYKQGDPSKDTFISSGKLTAFYFRQPHKHAFSFNIIYIMFVFIFQRLTTNVWLIVSVS